MNSIARFVAALVAAVRSMGRALKRVARPVFDKTGKIVDWALDRTHDALDVAEHAAAVPGAMVGSALGAVLGNRAPDAADIATMAMAAGDQRPRPAPVAAAPVQPAYDPTNAVLAAARDARGLECFHDLPQTHAAWLAYLSDEQRAAIANATPHQVRGHLTAVALLPGVPPVWTQARLDQANAHEALIRQHVMDDPVFDEALRNLERRFEEPQDAPPSAKIVRPARFNRRRPEAAEGEPVAMRM